MLANAGIQNDSRRAFPSAPAFIEACGSFLSPPLFSRYDNDRSLDKIFSLKGMRDTICFRWPSRSLAWITLTD
jgi:hypothetical protein